MTPREAAKMMITHAALQDLRNGRTETQIISCLQELYYGHCGPDYWGATGGYHSINGKPRKLQPWQIIVIDIDHVPCGQIFDLRPLVREIIQEQNTKQLSLWEAV